jgi:large subunit ribosomal protein L35
LIRKRELEFNMGKPRKKIKTSSSAAKRFSISKSGKIKRSKAYGSHILTKKSAKRMRRIKKGGYVSASEKQKITRLLPYG